MRTLFVCCALFFLHLPLMARAQPRAGPDQQTPPAVDPEAPPDSPPYTLPDTPAPAPYQALPDEPSLYRPTPLPKLPPGLAQDPEARHQFMLRFEDYRAGRYLRGGGIATIVVGCTLGLFMIIPTAAMIAMNMEHGCCYEEAAVGSALVMLSQFAIGLGAGIPMLKIGQRKMRQARQRVGLEASALPTPAVALRQRGARFALGWRF